MKNELEQYRRMKAEADNRNYNNCLKEMIDEFFPWEHMNERTKRKTCLNYLQMECSLDPCWYKTLRTRQLYLVSIGLFSKLDDFSLALLMSKQAGERLEGLIYLLRHHNSMKLVVSELVLMPMEDFRRIVRQLKAGRGVTEAIIDISEMSESILMDVRKKDLKIIEDMGLFELQATLNPSGSELYNLMRNSMANRKKAVVIEFKPLSRTRV